MDNIQAVADLLTEIVMQGTDIEATGDEFGGWISRSGMGVALTRRDRALMAKLTKRVRTDPIIALNASVKDVADEVSTTIFDGVTAREEGRFDADHFARDLLDRVRAGYQTWSVVWPVPGIRLPDGATLEVGGLTLGVLHADTRAAIDRDMTSIGKMVRLYNKPPGSALPSLMNQTDRTLGSSEYWALGTIEGRRASIKWIMEERVTIALDVLRVFGLYVGIDPDQTSLGDPWRPDERRSLFYNASQGAHLDESLFELRRPYELDDAAFQRLHGFPLFQRAQQIAGIDSPTELERKILLGILQFGAASRVRTAEEKFSAYLTAAETVLAREEDERHDRGKRVGRRLTLLDVFEDQQTAIDAMQELHAVRRLPVHFGHRTIRGWDVVTPAHIRRAKYVAYFAILVGLEHCAGHATHEAFIQALDRELVARGMTPGKPIP
jgi:hypothetical protein